MLKHVLHASLIWLLGATCALAASTVNPAVPAQNSQLSSAVVRNNFAATYNDITKILGKYAGATAPSNPVNMQDWVDTSASPSYVFKVYNQTTSSWVSYASLNINTGVYTPIFVSGSFVATTPLAVSVSGSGVVTYSLNYSSRFTVNGSNQLALGSLPVGSLLARCSGGTGEPGACTWTEFADAAIGSVNGMLPYRTGGTWGTISTGTSGAAIPILNAANTWGAVQTFPSPSFTGTASGVNMSLSGTLTVTGAFTATGLVTNADLVNSSVTVSGTTCTLGSSCSPPSSLVNASTPITGGSDGRILRNNAGILGEYTLSGSGTVVAMQTSPTLVTPSLGVATGTSLALNGCTIGSNGLCVSGTTALTSNSATAFAVGPNGATNSSLLVDSSTGSAATGWKITGNAAGGTGSLLTVISSGTNESGRINAKGSANLYLNETGTGVVSIGAGGGGVNIGSALTYGGVALSNAVTGTGNMVLSASPTFSGTVGGAGTIPLTVLATGTQDTVVGYWGSTSASAIAVNNCANALTYSTSTHTFGCNSVAGTGTVTSVAVANGGGLSVDSGSPITTSGTITLSLRTPTVQRLTSGTGATYTTAPGVKYIKVKICGGGGGGAGTGTGAGGGNGGTGGTSTFSGGSLSCTGGAGGGIGGPASGGTCTGSGQNYPGSAGGSVITLLAGQFGGGAMGGQSAFWAGAGYGSANSGSGGAGGQHNGAGNAGGGGGAGGCMDYFIGSPAATYTYTIGAAGTAGTAGTSGTAGNAGATGGIIVEEY